MHFGEQIGEEKDLEEEEPIEVITAGNYYNKNGKHYIKYEEIMEGEKENTSSLIKIQGDTLEVTKKGLNNVHMIFQKNKRTCPTTTRPLEICWLGSRHPRWKSKRRRTASGWMWTIVWKSTTSIWQTVPSTSMSVPKTRKKPACLGKQTGGKSWAVIWKPFSLLFLLGLFLSGNGRRSLFSSAEEFLT